MMDKNFNKNVGEILKNARIKKNISQYALADKTGIPRSSIVQYELGTQSVPLNRFIILCGTLDLDVNTCLKGIKL